MISLIKGYKYFVSPLLGQHCRFHPTCSEYAIDAIKHFGIFKGLFLATIRVIRCNPWATGGIDPLFQNTKK